MMLEHDKIDRAHNPPLCHSVMVHVSRVLIAFNGGIATLSRQGDHVCDIDHRAQTGVYVSTAL